MDSRSHWMVALTKCFFICLAFMRSTLGTVGWLTSRRIRITRGGRLGRLALNVRCLDLRIASICFFLTSSIRMSLGSLHLWWNRRLRTQYLLFDDTPAHEMLFFYSLVRFPRFRSSSDLMLNAGGRNDYWPIGFVWIFQVLHRNWDTFYCRIELKHHTKQNNDYNFEQTSWAAWPSSTSFPTYQAWSSPRSA